MNEIFERVAQALHQAHYHRGRGIAPAWDSIHQYEREMWFVSARAAIGAIWQPIETAPKDGTLIDLWMPGEGRLADCYWSTDGDEEAYWFQRYAESGSAFSIWNIDNKPSHWMPKPEAPSF